MSAHTSQLWFINLVSSPTENKRHYIALHCITLYCTALHCITLHYIPLHTITYHYMPCHAITLHYITFALHTIPLHTITYHDLPLHTLHAITHLFRVVWPWCLMRVSIPIIVFLTFWICFFDPEAVHGRVQKLYGAVLEGGILETIWKQYILIV